MMFVRDALGADDTQYRSIFSRRWHPKNPFAPKPAPAPDPIPAPPPEAEPPPKESGMNLGALALAAAAIVAALVGKRLLGGSPVAKTAKLAPPRPMGKPHAGPQTPRRVGRARESADPVVAHVDRDPAGDGWAVEIRRGGRAVDSATAPTAVDLGAWIGERYPGARVEARKAARMCEAPWPRGAALSAVR
jgi:hypothetical protein